ncbi:MAG: GrpE protein [Fibrobacteria bacterium]|jgi:molecular chaperone GrpE|nr:GrpE protein [Fibrobacteria bacterium]
MSEVRDDQVGGEDPKNSESIDEILAGAADAAATGTSDSDGFAKGSPKLEAEIAELKDKNLRLYAEFDNFRRRTAKESFEMMVTANAKLIEKLTDVLDNFNRAFDPQNKASAEDFEKGMKLIFGRFKDILDGEGLEEIDPSGTEFDPNLHEALLQQTSDTVPENHVIQTVSKGYKLKSKILKHAKVIVSKGKEE